MNKHFILGTAGHIDHGKTTLSKALTGIDTDRLLEEKKRNISIELGFAPFYLPNGDQVSLIDVPGHEKFIRHMVAGVGGIDLVLLIIAADEGVMPQTQEHLHIIELLDIQHGIVVITKRDLVDEEFYMLVEDEVKTFLKDTILSKSPIIPVSAVTNEGIKQLKSTIQLQLGQITERPHSGFFRMPIDRVFTLKGIGTVITGTVYSGSVYIEQELELMPSNRRVRVRSLQIHSQNVEKAYAGQRVAINLTGIEVNKLRRGDSIVTPNQWESSNRLDVELHIVKDLDFPIPQNSEIKLLIGTNERSGTLNLYDRKELFPGETAYAQIKLNEAIISSRKDRFIIRRPSPSTTIGGGTIIDPNAEKHKHRKETTDYLKKLSKGTIEELIIEQLIKQDQSFLTSSMLSKLLVLPENEVLIALNRLIEKEKVIQLGQAKDQFFSLVITLDDYEHRLISHLKEYHATYTLRIGQPKAEFIKQFFPYLKLKYAKEIVSYWEKKQLILTKEEFIAEYHFSPTISEKWRSNIDALEEKLITQGFSPDDWDTLTNAVTIHGKDKLEVYNFLITQRKVYKLTDKLVIHHRSFEKLKQLISDYLLEEKQITLQQAKELLDVSRKYLVPLMELLDNEKITVLREGHDYRILRDK